MPFAALSAWAATFPVRTLPQEEGPLEPSVQHEVDHAVDRAERWLAAYARTAAPAAAAVATNAAPVAVPGDLFATNGLSRGAVALKLVSSQKGAGWWLTPTNSVPTRVACDILKGL